MSLSKPSLCLPVLTVLAACASAPVADNANAPTAYGHLASTQLEQFGSNREFQAWLRATYEAAEIEDLDWDGSFTAVDTSKQTSPDICDEDKEGCDEADTIVVTGSRIASPVAALSAVQITNSQVGQVDEGDVIKQLGDYLIILHDGRLTSASLRPDGQAGLALIDRIDIYTDPDRQIWYDEILVVDGRILVTAYSYQDDATEFTVFSMNADGQFTRDARFLLTSDDYWSSNNYATRIIGNQLVIYTPTYLDYVDDLDAVPLPNMRRAPLDSRTPITTVDDGRGLLDYQDIYRPLQVELIPAIHAVTRCDIESAGTDDAATCSTTAFVGGNAREFYVSPDHVYVWSAPMWQEDRARYDSSSERCAVQRGWQQAVESVVHRVEVSSGEISAVRIRGFPNDQYAISHSDDRLHAVLSHFDWQCATPTGNNGLFYMSLPLSHFSARNINSPLDAFTNLPNLPGPYGTHVRFSADHAVIASRETWRNRPTAAREDNRGSLAMSFPVVAPAQLSLARLEFSVARLETLGETFFATGYSDTQGLRLAQLDPRDGVRVTHTGFLKDRIESEGRSHAFNLTRLDDETLLLGLPTIGRGDETRPRWWWYQDNSDVSFMQLNSDNGFFYAGNLSSDPENVHPDYDCDVSCIDWYGNSRPVFTFGRIFALSGTEIIEGELLDGHIRELRRINLTAPIARLSNP